MRKTIAGGFCFPPHYKVFVAGMTDLNSEFTVLKKYAAVDEVILKDIKTWFDNTYIFCIFHINAELN